MTELPAIRDSSFLADFPVMPTETGLMFTGPLTFEQYTNIGVQLFRLREGLPWLLGDWLVYGERVFGEEAAQAIADTYSLQTLQNYAWVARAIPAKERRHGVSFSHHSEVAKYEKEIRETWLDMTEQNGWNVAELRVAIRDWKEAAEQLSSPEAKECPDIVYAGLSGADEKTMESIRRGVPVNGSTVAPVVTWELDDDDAVERGRIRGHEVVQILWSLRDGLSKNEITEADLVRMTELIERALQLCGVLE